MHDRENTRNLQINKIETAMIYPSLTDINIILVAIPSANWRMKNKLLSNERKFQDFGCRG